MCSLKAPIIHFDNAVFSLQTIKYLRRYSLSFSNLSRGAAADPLLTLLTQSNFRMGAKKRFMQTMATIIVSNWPYSERRCRIYTLGPVTTNFYKLLHSFFINTSFDMGTEWRMFSQITVNFLKSVLKYCFLILFETLVDSIFPFVARLLILMIICNKRTPLKANVKKVLSSQ